MENYRTGVDDGNDLDSIDFELLVRNIEVGIFFISVFIFINFIRNAWRRRWTWFPLNLCLGKAFWDVFGPEYAPKFSVMLLASTK